MTLEQCTKKELIEIIRRCVGKHCYTQEQMQSEIRSLLSGVELRRKQSILKEAENWSEIAHTNRMKYCELLKPYDGMKLIDIPSDVIYEADRLLKDAQYADRKWDELMRKADI